jgi:hypothetical protein
MVNVTCWSISFASGDGGARETMHELPLGRLGGPEGREYDHPITPVNPSGSIGHIGRAKVDWVAMGAMGPQPCSVGRPSGPGAVGVHRRACRTADATGSPRR